MPDWQYPATGERGGPGPRPRRGVPFIGVSGSAAQLHPDGRSISPTLRDCSGTREAILVWTRTKWGETSQYLLQFLQEFSQQTISRTHEIKKQVDGLIRETKATDCRLHNVFNDFLMLSNTQFIENTFYKATAIRKRCGYSGYRYCEQYKPLLTVQSFECSLTQLNEKRVYDEEVEEPVLKAEAEKTDQEKTREQKEVDLIPKVQEAVNYGLQVLDSAFEQLDIKAGNSDSEEDDANGRVELILEPKLVSGSQMDQGVRWHV
ncbi:WASH complex subunit 2C [Saguinus oedipus]|uniref:WASH complex subunit 2C n=1 Tax=Saguinus oedipus TaxID=9490 RepID=A0ABQ9UML3_SAGOE|nr:WASH complex subunit 2C [Saguinus oedipus]